MEQVILWYLFLIYFPVEEEATIRSVQAGRLQAAVRYNDYHPHYQMSLARDCH